MRKLISLSLLFFAFLLVSTSAMAQDETQKKFWKKAEKQTEKLTDSIDLNDNEKAYVTRHIFNYHVRLDALNQNMENLPFDSKSEVNEHFDLEMKTVLGEEQYSSIKELVDKLVEEDSK